MSLDPQLLEVLACPQDHGPLTYLEDKNVLVNPRLKVSTRCPAFWKRFSMMRAQGAPHEATPRSGRTRSRE